MIRLRAVFHAEDLAKYDPSALPPLARVEDDLEAFWDSLGDRSLNADIAMERAEDELGTQYLNFRAQAVGRVETKGERWILTSAGFMVSLDSILATMAANYDELGL